MIQKVYSRDPLVCPKCSGKMIVIALIDDVAVIRKILLHLDLWETRNHNPPPGKILLEFVPDQAQHLEQLTMALDLQYPNIDSNRYEDDYSQLLAEELCSKHSAFR
ncbi:MAG: hypothetical protein U1E11_05965 [Dethiobacteria bacterium]|nr:hypothetical protein [Dethiobacteria bacterium]